jgi:glycosyltransferase involved in cell wall biosynthesis
MINKNSYVLITVPHLSLPGGVTGLFNLLKLNKDPEIDYFSVNFNPKKWGVLFLPVVFLIFFLKVRKYDTVHINPSMDSRSFYRDLVFTYIAKSYYKKKTIIYWHGWQKEFFTKIYRSRFLTYIFKKTFGKADIQIVLAKEFAHNLKSLGFKKEILLESNVTENISFDENKLNKKDNLWQLLYLSRITEGKGWDIAIKTMKVLQESGVKNIKLILAGDGDCFNHAKKLIKDFQLNNTELVGYVKGESKKKLLTNSDLLFFPTCYGEGMPVAILEGMMHGLPVITRKVGGIGDHLKDGVCGFVTESRDPEVFANLILSLTTNHEKYNQIKIENIKIAKEEFIPERLIKRLIDLYR